MKRLLLTLLALSALALSASPGAAAPPPAQTLQSAADVLDELAAIPARGIPPALLANAHGVAIIPRTVKAGFIIGGRGGHGVVLSRDRTGAWGEPVFVNFGGGSIGLQAGIQSTDLVLVFKGRESLNRILEGKGKLTLGADVSVAAGPVGRQAEAGTDAVLKAEIVSYSRARGLFAGVALDGAALWFDLAANAQFQRDPRPEVRQLAALLQARLAAMSMLTPTVQPVPLMTAPPPLAVPLPPGPEVTPPPQRLVPVRPEPR
jgi:lipid-binding SYLF domain-containing protein